MSLVFTLTVAAQVSTGGTPVHTEPKLYKEETYAAFSNLTAVLLKREVECDVTKSVQKKDTLMDSYHRLTLKSKNGDCLVESETLTCIKNPEYQKVAAIMESDPASINFIKSEFKIDFESAKKIYEFLIDLDDERPKTTP